MNLDILYLNKSSYDNGKLSGKYFSKVKFDIKYIENLLSDSIVKDKIEVLFDKLRKEYPKYYDEVIGKADGIGIDRLTYFSILCPEIVNKYSEHCTTIMCKKDNGNFVISHNEDDNYLKGNFCLSKIKIDDKNRFVTNDMYEMPFGNGMSWNSYGIVKTINYCHDEEINLDNYPRYFAQRHLTEAKSIEDLINRCKEISIASGFHVNVIDINRNIAATIEVHSNKIDVEYIDDFYIHSNHFIHKKYGKYPKADKGSNSIFRFNECKKLFKERTMESIQKILSYKTQKNQLSILQTKRRSSTHMTLYNFSYDVDNKNIIYLNDYMHGEAIKLDYNL